MALYALGDLVPRIHPDAYVHPEATVIGDVTIGAGSTVWPQAVLRGDDGAIVVGERSSIQDGAVVHTAPVCPTTIGDDCTVGHLAHLEACTMRNGSLAGVGSVIRHNVVVGEGALVGSGAVVLDGTEIPPAAIAVGVPARIRPDASDPQMLVAAAASYERRGPRYKAELRRLD
ncbi:MAG: gamma carbonic anhydrase family protein [bacterium]|nr:gamma carbonic anhydrase family protein [bacterium]MDE0668554.1 gamma carbonic anhydrase family protein [bacterium]